MTHAIVHCARSWLGTRFHHQGRLKKTALHKGGVDCLGLLVGVAAELGLHALTAADETNYSHHPDAVRLRKRLSALLTPILSDQIAPGDVLLLDIDGNPQHLALVSDIGGALGIIHAYAPARAVVEHQLDAWWQKRIEAAFRIINPIV